MACKLSFSQEPVEKPVPLKGFFGVNLGVSGSFSEKRGPNYIGMTDAMFNLSFSYTKPLIKDLGLSIILQPIGVFTEIFAFEGDFSWQSSLIAAVNIGHGSSLVSEAGYGWYGGAGIVYNLLESYDKRGGEFYFHKLTIFGPIAVTGFRIPPKAGRTEHIDFRLSYGMDMTVSKKRLYEIRLSFGGFGKD
ncbi:hypothetical protein [Flavihumibacter sp.]|uniref:hypothetical protein n=1 Tax=Flavihumibacter sp. TaxID=1913981 RepID=UPI002FCB85F8